MQSELAAGWDELTRSDWLKAISGQSDVYEFERCGLHYAVSVADLMPHRTDINVLEIGAGVGRIMRPLAPLCKTITGVDISKEMVERSEEYLKDHKNAKVRLIEDTSLSLCPDESMDFVYAIGCFIHCDLETIRKLMQSARRVLRPKAMLYCDIHALPSSTDRKSPPVRANGVIEVRPFELMELADEWSEHDCRVVRSRYVCKFYK